jgi:phenylacetate-coenzyme A ligase PaaK-like adenylate-forming protein
VDLDTGEIVHEGLGQMVITGLYPFNQAVPKIRYVVGDLVEIRRTTCGSREPGVRFLARASDAVRVPNSSPAHFRLFSSDVAEVLAPLPDVGRKEKTGFLKFRLSSTPEGEAHVEIELTYPPAAFPARVRELSSYLLESLAARSNQLGSPQIAFLRPGLLGKITKV